MTVAARVVEGFAVSYRRTWKGSVFSSIVSPLLFLVAMGSGLGLLVDEGTGPGIGLAGVSYLAFIAPGVLAATAMQNATGDCTWPVLGGIKWQKGYHAMLATPVGVGALVTGHLTWVAIRLLATSTIFFVVALALGAWDEPTAVLGLPVAVLTGMAFAAPISAFSATRENQSGFSALMRFGIQPMFLFSGTFFPVDQLPDALQVVAWATPLFHGVSLARAAALGPAAEVSAAAAVVHVAYLLACFGVGVVVARRAFRRTLWV